MVNYQYENALHNAAKNCDIEALLRCLTPEALAACPIDTRDRENHTVLHAICRYEGRWRENDYRRVDDRNAEDVEMCVQLLVDAGADLEARDSCGCSPLQVVAWISTLNLGTEATLRLTSLLLSHGAEVNTRANDDRDVTSTLLHTAVSFAHYSVVSLLLKAGAAVNALTRDFKGTPPGEPAPATPLDMAFVYGCRTTVSILLRAGGVLNRYQRPGFDLARSTSGVYLAKVDASGGFKKYEQAHLATLTKTFAPKFPMLPPEMVRHILTFGFHAGFY